MTKKIENKFITRGKNGEVIINPIVLEALNIDIKTELKLGTDGKSIIISPKKPKKQKKLPKLTDDSELQEVYEQVSSTYSKALKKLAKS